LPTTQLSAASCNSTLSSLYQYFYIDRVSGATRYQYEITGTGFADSALSLFNYPSAIWYSLGFVNGVQPNTSYNIRVRPYVNGVWGSFGPSCALTTPTFKTAPNQHFQTAIFPNPNNGEFHLSVDGFPLDDGELTIQVFNAVGKDFGTVPIHPPASTFDLVVEDFDLASGIYFVILTSKSGQVTHRMVVN